MQSSVMVVMANCPSFTFPSMKTPICPGDNLTFICRTNSSYDTVNQEWKGSAFNCTPAGFTPNAITLSQSAGQSPNPAVVSCGNLSAVMTNVSGTCYTSILTIPTPQYYNGTTVQCFYVNSANNLIGNHTINTQLASPPSAPTITLNSTYSNVTVNWTPVPTATSYNVSINGSTPISIPADVSIYIFTGLTSTTIYTVSVVAINCAGTSSAVIQTTQTAGTPTPTPSSGSPEVCVLTVHLLVSVALGICIRSVGLGNTYSVT